jgi:hypothetical protein
LSAPAAKAIPESAFWHPTILIGKHPSPIAFPDLNEHRQKIDKNIPAFLPTQTKKILLIASTGSRVNRCDSVKMD